MFRFLPLHPRSHAARLLGFFGCKKRPDVSRVDRVVEHHLHLARLVLVLDRRERDVAAHPQHAEGEVAQLLDSRHA